MYERVRHIEYVPEQSEADTNYITADPDAMSIFRGAWNQQVV